MSDTGPQRNGPPEFPRGEWDPDPPSRQSAASVLKRLIPFAIVLVLAAVCLGAIAFSSMGKDAAAPAGTPGQVLVRG